MFHELTHVIGDPCRVRFISRDCKVRGTGSYLQPHCAEIRVTLYTAILNPAGRVLYPEHLLELTQIVYGALDGKILVCESDEWKDEICGLAGIGVAECIVLDGVTLELICSHVKGEIDSWLFESEIRDVYVRSVEVRDNGYYAAVRF